MNTAGSKTRKANLSFNEARFITDFLKAIRPVLIRSECGGLLRKSQEVERTIYLACAKTKMEEQK
jgi:hypothetical protein